MRFPMHIARNAATAALPLLLAVRAAAPPASAAPAGPYTVPPCNAASLVVHADGQDGRFGGKSHGGAVLTVRNVSTTACAVSGVPTLALRTASGRTVAKGVPAGARFMHPGPVVIPVVLGPGEIAGATLRWVSSPVYPHSMKAVAASLALVTLDGVAKTPLAVVAYGPASGVTFEQSRLTTALPDLGDATPASEVTASRWYGSGPAGSTYLAADGRPAKVLDLALGAKPKPTFAFDLSTGAPTPNIGSIAGSLDVEGTRATFADPKRDCALGFTFYGGRLEVTQSGTCGFGNGVSAEGRYTAAP